MISTNNKILRYYQMKVKLGFKFFNQREIYIYKMVKLIKSNLNIYKAQAENFIYRFDILN